MADFDKKIAEALENDETFLAILGQLREAATNEVSVRDDRPCTKDGCGCKHIRMVKVPDYKLKLEIIKFLSERGVGRPAQADNVDDSEKIVFTRCSCGKWK